MVFSSWQFILVYLPISLSVYFCLNHYRLVRAGKVWLVMASLVFYAYWDVAYLPMMLCSILLNFGIGTKLAQTWGGPGLQERQSTTGQGLSRKAVLIAGITLNLLLLAYYKYTDFLIYNVNAVFGTGYPELSGVLPLAISFFTFTQIVYLVDSYRGETGRYDLLNYSLFVTFFPHLIAGPIVHHRQIMPQFASRWTLALRHKNVLGGLFLFAIGLFKKIVIADQFAVWADAGFAGGAPLGFFAAWAATLSYTFQIYFDFSGYCDMAAGASLMFNIWLPVNFNSPYKALDIQDFWRRWHITLSNFLRDYLYIPLGGNQAYINLFITFILGGLWHGATWMFVIWGALHGCAVAVHRLWKTRRRPLPPVLAWLLTFIFINFTWVFFRAKSMDDAMHLLRGMLDVRSAFASETGSVPVSDLAWAGWLSDVLPVSLVAHVLTYLAIAAAFIIVWQKKNAIEMVVEPISNGRLFYSAILFIVAIHFMLASTSTVFLYFNF